MSQDRVDQPMAERLRGAGWKVKTELKFRPEGDLTRCECHTFSPAPSIGELLQRLSDDEIIRYVFAHNNINNLMGASLMKMALAVIRDADVLAEVWLWAQKGEA